MPKRNGSDLDELSKSLSLINQNGHKQVIVGGDFNCPDINGETNTTQDNCQDRNIQNALIDLANEHDLSQIHAVPTREKNILDLVFTSNPTLCKSSSSIPGISDHAITISDFDIKPDYVTQKKRKVFQYRKANWNKIAGDLTSASNHIVNSDGSADVKWNHLKKSVNDAIQKHVPHKFVKNNYSPPWLNRKLRNKLKKKAKLYKKAKNSSNWDRYRAFQKRCKRSFRKAEQDYIVKINK